jgi:hypothetical protein
MPIIDEYGPLMQRLNALDENITNARLEAQAARIAIGTHVAGSTEREAHREARFKAIEVEITEFQAYKAWLKTNRSIIGELSVAIPLFSGLSFVIYKLLKLTCGYFKL